MKEILVKVKTVTNIIMTIQSTVVFWATAFLMLLASYKILHAGGTVHDVTRHYAETLNIPDTDVLSDMHQKELCKVYSKDPACRPKGEPCKK